MMQDCKAAGDCCNSSQGLQSGIKCYASWNQVERRAMQSRVARREFLLAIGAVAAGTAASAFPFKRLCRPKYMEEQLGVTV